jgi:hypothetical protein
LIWVTETSVAYFPGLFIDENTEIVRKHHVDFLSYYVVKEGRVMIFPGPGTDMTFPSQCCILKDAECEQNNGRERMPSSWETAGARQSYLIESMHISLPGSRKGYSHDPGV